MKRPWRKSVPSIAVTGSECMMLGTLQDDGYMKNSALYEELQRLKFADEFCGEIGRK